VGVWDPAEHAMTKTLERRFSAGSSGGAGAAMLHGSGNRCRKAKQKPRRHGVQRGEISQLSVSCAGHSTAMNGTSCPVRVEIG
jgi:hypothetical protein